MKTLNEGLFKRLTKEEKEKRKEERLQYKRLKKKFHPLGRTLLTRSMLGAIIGITLILNCVMEWRHVTPELYHRYQQYYNTCIVRYDEMTPQEKAKVDEQLVQLKEKYGIADDIDINKMSQKDFVNYVDKYKTALDNEDYRSTMKKGWQAGSNTVKNLKNAFWKVLNRFGIQNPFEGSEIHVRSPFYMKETRNMTFKEYLSETEQIKRRINIGKILGYVKRTLVAVFAAAGLTMSMANLKAEEIIDSNIKDPNPIVQQGEFGLGAQSFDNMKLQDIVDVNGVVDDAEEVLQDPESEGSDSSQTPDSDDIKGAGMTTYDKATELGKDLIDKGMDLRNKAINKASELATEENLKKLKSKIPSKKQLGNILQQGFDKAKGFLNK